MREIVQGSDAGYPLFYAVFDRVAPATNKHMATLFRSAGAGTLGIVEVTRVYLFNWDVSPGRISSKLLEQRLVFITSPPAGLVVSTFRVDTGATDTFSLVVARTGATGATIPSDGLIRRFFAEQGNSAQGQAQGEIIYERKLGDSGLICRGGRGISIQNISDPGSNPGTCSYVFEWHVDTDKTSF